MQQEAGTSRSGSSRCHKLLAIVFMCVHRVEGLSFMQAIVTTFCETFSLKQALNALTRVQDTRRVRGSVPAWKGTENELRSEASEIC